MNGSNPRMVRLEPGMELDPDRYAVFSANDLPIAPRQSPFGGMLGSLLDTPVAVEIDGIAMHFLVSQHVPAGQIYVFDTRAMQEALREDRPIAPYVAMARNVATEVQP